MTARRRTAWLIVSALVLVAGSAGVGAATVGSDVAIHPHRGGPHATFVVTFTTQHATGVFGRTLKSYTATARAVHPRTACVNDRADRLPEAPAGVVLHARLRAFPGKGGTLGWCRGRYRGRVVYEEGFTCPPKGTCRPPAGFPHRREVVGRFTFRVR